MTLPNFPKRARSNEELLAVLIERGLSVSDPDAALTDLLAHGYHRLGGYRYPLRLPLAPGDQDPAQRRYRADEFIAGASHDDVMRLFDFDRRFRSVILEALLDFEGRLRAALIETVCQRGAFAHLNIPAGSLDPDATTRRQARTSATHLELWKVSLSEAIRAAKTTDAVAHHLVRYPGAPPPVWIALNVVPFGSLPFFMDLLRDADRNEIARLFGIRNGNTLTKWTRAFVDLRNACAHGARVFNASVKRKFTVRPSEVPEGALQHLIGWDSPKIYMHLALLMHALASHPAGNNWRLAIRTRVRKFPTGITDGGGFILDESTMGFPSNWEELDPWA